MAQRKLYFAAQSFTARIQTYVTHVEYVSSCSSIGQCYAFLLLHIYVHISMYAWIPSNANQLKSLLRVALLAFSLKSHTFTHTYIYKCLYISFFLRFQFKFFYVICIIITYFFFLDSGLVSFNCTGRSMLSRWSSRKKRLHNIIILKYSKPQNLVN